MQRTMEETKETPAAGDMERNPSIFSSPPKHTDPIDEDLNISI